MSVINSSKAKNNMASLLTSQARVEAPFVRVTIGGYTFGVRESKIKGSTNSGVITEIAEKYPNYIQNLSVKKINGSVNTYTLSISYPITENDDPNFFERLFSRVSGTRNITFTYGDAMLPEYVYREEEAVITKVTTTFKKLQSQIDYTVEAVSTATVALSGSYTFPYYHLKKPSDIIKQLIDDNHYNLKQVFTAMKSSKYADQMNWIASDDQEVDIPTFVGMSVLDYINKLVSYMRPNGSPKNSVIKSNVYSLDTVEDEKGLYFRVRKIQGASNALNQLCTYVVDVGYPTSNVVMDFQIKNNENWSIYYNYNQSLDNSDYLKRINSKGEVEYIYSPVMTGNSYNITESQTSWWTQVTQYPISATLKLKGLLKPAILMTYVKLNVWFFGKKHIASGYYTITAQQDEVGLNGYYTTLTLVRVAADEDLEEA